jgi:hypothetical protein
MKNNSHNQLGALCCFIFTAFAGYPAVIYGPVTNSANDHIYYLLSQSTWTAAEAEAVTLGGHLATVRSDAENSWVLDTFSSHGGSFKTLWIGLYDTNGAGYFGWVSGETNVYRKWSAGEPNYIGVERYTHVYDLGRGGFAYNWNNYCDCTEEFGVPLHGVVEVTPAPPMVSIRVSEVEVCWTFRSNRTYQVQYRSQLNTNQWTDFGAPIPGSSGTNCITDEVIVGQPQRFYRVVERP